MKLSELEKGTRAMVESVNLDANLKKRFSSMGLSPGIILRVCRRTFGSGLHVKIECSACLALSKAEASHIEVRPIGKGSGSGHGWQHRRNQFCCDREDCSMKEEEPSIKG